jgi:telomerase reverse transcriptase
MGHKPSKTDIDKRYEMFHEFVYYAFDSLLIPLLRSNFYVTETNRHRYQIFYFRHDMWKRVAEPAMATLKQKMFEEVKLGDATRILDSRRLGFSQIRLLPKKADLRPIMNLRRRALGNRGSKVLGPSINSILSPVHLLLKLEKV